MCACVLVCVCVCVCVWVHPFDTCVFFGTCVRVCVGVVDIVSPLVVDIFERVRWCDCVIVCSQIWCVCVCVCVCVCIHLSRVLVSFDHVFGLLC